MEQFEGKRIWVVYIRQIFEGYFYVAASSPQMARRLAWAHFADGHELRGL